MVRPAPFTAIGILPAQEHGSWTGQHYRQHGAAGLHGPAATPSLLTQVAPPARDGRGTVGSSWHLSYKVIAIFFLS
jgi:hypothetical protein